MTIEELQEKKANLQTEMTVLINNFCGQTGISPYSISISQEIVKISTGMDTCLTHITITI